MRLAASGFQIESFLIVVRVDHQVFIIRSGILFYITLISWESHQPKILTLLTMIASKLLKPNFIASKPSVIYSIDSLVCLMQTN